MELRGQVRARPLYSQVKTHLTSLHKKTTPGCSNDSLTPCRIVSLFRRNLLLEYLGNTCHVNLKTSIKPLFAARMQVSVVYCSDVQRQGTHSQTHTLLLFRNVIIRKSLLGLAHWQKYGTYWPQDAAS